MDKKREVKLMLILHFVATFRGAVDLRFQKINEIRRSACVAGRNSGRDDDRKQHEYEH